MGQKGTEGRRPREERVKRTGITKKKFKRRRKGAEMTRADS